MPGIRVSSRHGVKHLQTRYVFLKPLRMLQRLLEIQKYRSDGVKDLLGQLSDSFSFAVSAERDYSELHRCPLLEVEERLRNHQHSEM